MSLLLQVTSPDGRVLWTGTEHSRLITAYPGRAFCNFPKDQTKVLLVYSGYMDIYSGSTYLYYQVVERDTGAHVTSGDFLKGSNVQVKGLSFSPDKSSYYIYGIQN